MPDFGVSEGIALGSALAGTGMSAAQMAKKPSQPFSPISSASGGSAPITAGQRPISPLVQGNQNPQKYSAIADLMNGASYA